MLSSIRGQFRVPGVAVVRLHGLARCSVAAGSSSIRLDDQQIMQNLLKGAESAMKGGVVVG